jgi:hypothetical protein
MPATRVACLPLKQVDLLAVEELQIREEKMGWQRSGFSTMLVRKVVC